MSERVVLKRGQTPTKRGKAKTGARKKGAPQRGAKRKSSRPWVAPVVASGLALTALGAAWLYDLPGQLWMATAKTAANAGFEVRDVELTGAREMEKLPLYTAALDGASDSMLLVDLDEVKARLETLPWVAEAHVGRQWPDRLLIDIDERVPAAIWQNEGRHRLVDATGLVLPARDVGRFAELPLIVDDRANENLRGLLILLRDYPALADRFAAASWRGNRRWDITLDSGEIVMLPQDQGDVRRALDAFVRMDRETGLTGRGFASLDFRVPKQMVVRAGDEVDGSVPIVKGTEI
ncbi:MAG: cell division protein FtsQ/DivIB [Pacificimonas sp.]